MRRERRDRDVDLERADQRQELADEAGGAGQPDIGQREHHEHQRVERHAVDEPAIGGDLARVHAVVDDADAEEQRGRHDAVRDHLEDAAGDALRGQREDAHGDEAHMRHRRIGDQLLHVLLHQRDQRGVDDRDDREREDQRREIHRGVREHRQREAQEAVAAHLQQDRGEDDRARGRRLDMRVGQPGVHRPHRHLHGERGEEGEPQPGLHARREARDFISVGMSVVPACQYIAMMASSISTEPSSV